MSSSRRRTDVHSHHENQIASQAQHTALLEDIKTNTSNINVNVGDVEINVQQVEDLLATTNAKLIEISGKNTDIDVSVKANSITVAKLNQILTKNTEIDSVLDSCSAKLTDVDDSVKANSITVAKLNQILVKNGELKTLLTDISAKASDVDNSVTASSAVVSKLTQINNKMDTDNIVFDNQLVKQTEAEAHLGNIDTGIDVIESCVGSNKVNVNISSGSIALPSGAATSALQNTMESSLNSIQTSVELLDNVVAGSEIQCDVITMPTVAITHSALTELGSAINLDKLDVVVTNSPVLGAGSAAIGKLSANSGVDIGDVDVISLPLTFNSGNKGATTQRIVLATDDIPIALVNTKLQAGNVLLGTIDSDTDAIKTSCSAIATDVAANEVLHTAANALLTTIDADTNAIKTAVQLLDNCVDGNFLNVNQSVAGADVAVNSGNKGSTVPRMCIATDDIPIALVNTKLQAGNVLLGTIDADTNDIKTSVQILDDIVLAEDSAHSSGNKGVMSLAVRNDVLESLGADNDYQPLQVDAYGALYSVNSANWSAITSLFSASVPASGGSNTGTATNIPITPNSIMVIECIATITSDGGNGNNSYTVAIEGAIASGGLYQTIQGNINDVQGSPVVSFIADIPTVRPFLKLLITNNHNVAQTFNIRSVRHGN